MSDDPLTDPDLSIPVLRVQVNGIKDDQLRDRNDFNISISKIEKAIEKIENKLIRTALERWSQSTGWLIMFLTGCVMFMAGVWSKL